MDTFNWQASESAPENYPMQIVSGHLSYVSGGSLYVPDKATLHHGWGRGWSSHIVGPDLKPLPNRLGITFFSYTEDQFYSGSFELPYDKILALFQAGYYSQNQGKEITYDQIIAGVAPGGAVSVWLSGIDRTTEIFHGLADKEDGDWHWINDNPKYSREEYIRLAIKDSMSPEAIKALQKNGIPFGQWERYHKARYHWQPLFTNMPLYKGLITVIKYFNGEQGFLNYPLDTDQINVTRAVPSEMVFVWDQPKAKPLRIKLYFDETEIFETFEKLGKHKLPLQLEMRIAIINGKSDFTVWLRNEKQAVELKKISVKTYGIPERKE